VLPLLLFFVGLIAYPVIQLVWMAFGDVRLVAGDLLWRFVGLENFERMLGDATFARSLSNSAVFIFFSVVLTLVLGIALALATDKVVRTQQWVQNVLIWPAIIAPVVISVIWLLILSPQIGLLNKLLASIGLTPQTWLGEPVGAMASIILVDVWHWTPIVFLFVYTALRGLDASVLEAAQMDGASYASTVRHIILPLLTPAIIGVTAIRIVMGVKAFDEMYLLTFGGPGDATTVITIYLRSIFFEAFQYGYGAALSVTVVVLVIIVILFAFGFQAVLRRLSRG
jgi:multiple sugar transport system permease protein